MRKSTNGKTILPGGITPTMLKGLSESDIRNLHRIKDSLYFSKFRSFLITLLCNSLAHRSDDPDLHDPFDANHFEDFEDLFKFLVAIEPSPDKDDPRL